MTTINLITEFFNVATLVGIAILSRHVNRGWQIFIGAALVFLGLITGVK